MIYKKKKILFIFTGGTINSGFSQKSKFVKPDKKTFYRLHNFINNSFHESSIELIFREPLGVPGEDSSNIHPGHWLTISKMIAEEIKKGISGVIVLYGTDTMAYFSSWLHLCFPNINIPVIITGSQLTLDYNTEDVTVNLSGALQVVNSGYNGVWIYCNWKLIPGNRAHKSRASHPDMFISNNDRVVDFEPGLPWKKQKGIPEFLERYNLPKQVSNIFSYSTEKIKNIYKKVEWLICFPGITPKLSPNKKVLCIIGFGAGNAPISVLNCISNYYLHKEKPCIIACSQAEKDIKKPDHYENVGIAELVKKGFRVWSQLDYPVEFIHALTVYALLCFPDHPDNILSSYLQEIFSLRLDL